MSTPRKSIFASLGTAVEIFSSATAVSKAIQVGRAPKDSDLKVLGIDPVAYRSIGRP